MLYLFQLVGEDTDGVVDLDEQLLEVVLPSGAAVGLHARDARVARGTASFLRSSVTIITVVRNLQDEGLCAGHRSSGEGGAHCSPVSTRED